MSRGPWSDMAVHGPRLGDRVRLGDTGLMLEVMADDRLAGDELLLGFAKTGRDGMGLQAVRAAESCDVVITNVLLLDPVLGVRVTSIGIREGRIAALGRAGNPDTTDGIDVVVGSGTVVIPGEGLIATPGAVDTHVHGLSPRVMEAALASGVTSLITQEFGPFWGVGVGSGWALRQAYAAFDAWPVNVGVLGRGSSALQDPLLEALEAGVCGFKVHEDTGAHLRTLDAALVAAEEHDVQVCLHTDGLNEGLTVADTLAVLDGRAVHAFHVEGCGGGHTPDVLRLAGVDHVLASSTNPTLPFGVNALAEHVSMIMVSHGLHPDLPGDLDLARSRVRAETMGAENLLHDHGVIPMTSSDALGMGRAGETWRRTFGLAAVTKGAPGARSTPTMRRPATTTTACCATSPSSPSTPRSCTASPTRSAPCRSGGSPTSCCGGRRTSPPSRPWWSRAASPRGGRSATRTPPPTPSSRCGTARSSAGTAPPRPSCRCCSPTGPQTSQLSRSPRSAGGCPCATPARCGCRSWCAMPDSRRSRSTRDRPR